MSDAPRPRLSDLSPERYAAVCALVERLRALGDEERSATLANSALDDPELAAHAGIMLGGARVDVLGGAARQALEAAAFSFMDADASGHPASGAALPRRLGRYLLIAEIGRGGMGTVFEAEQENPRRRVAVKILHGAIEDSERARRFELEARLLGQLHHPGIAQVHEAGFARGADGRPVPYMAMELVSGLALLDFARERELDLGARLDLLASVCDAVQHAHARRIVHRDLKPANVLVDEQGHPKVLDFGVARALDAELEGATLLTRSGHVLGTLAYMSPEQAAGRAHDVDARSDVYSLGVMGYELVSGRRPQETGGLDLPSALRSICETEPPTLGSLDSKWRGDVETIIAKALAKDPERRYGSAAELAADIRRSRSSVPIQARRPSVGYRAVRFVRRHRPLVSGVVGIVIVLAAGTIVSTRLALREGAARREAEEAKALAEERADEARRGQRASLLALAVTALREGDAAGAGKHLEAMPEEDRNWTWRHVSASLDESLAHATVNPGGPEVEMGFDASGREVAFLEGLAGVVVRFDAETAERVGAVSVPAGGRLVVLDAQCGRLITWAAGSASVVDIVTGTSVPLPLPFDDVIDGQVGPATCVAWLRGAVGSQEAVGVVELGGGDGATSAPGKSPEPRLRSLLRGGTPEIGEHYTYEVRAGRTPALSPDGTLLAAPSKKAGVGVTIWDTATGELLRECPGRDGLFDVVAFSPTAETLVAAGAGGLSAAWDVATGRRLRWSEVPLGQAHLSSITFAHDGRHVFLLDVEGRGALVAMDDGRVVWTLEQTRGSARVRPRLSPDGRVLAVAARATVLLIDSATGSVLKRLVGHEAQVRAIAFDPGGRLLATADGHGGLRTWPAAPGGDPRILAHEGYVYGVAASPDGTRIASAGWDGAVRLWDAATSAPVVALRAPGPKGWYGLVAYSPDGEWLASSHDCLTVVWRARTGERVATHPSAFVSQPCEVEALTWRPDGTRLLIAGRGTNLEEWEFQAAGDEGSACWPLMARAAACSPDGTLVALGIGNEVEIRDLATRAQLRVLRGHVGTVRKVAWSPDGRLVASGADDRTVRAWDLAGEAALAVLRGHSGSVYALAFSPDGRLLASGGNDDTIRLWDPERWEFVAELFGHSSYVHDLAWSPGGGTLLSASGDRTVRLWETRPLGERLRARLLREDVVRRLGPKLAALGDAPLPPEEAVARMPGLDPGERAVALDLAVGRWAEEAWRGVAGPRPR